MHPKKRPTILLTNDDGIESPGLWAAADALDSLGEVYVVAPCEQSTGAGRSLPGSSSGTITPRQVQINGNTRSAYCVGGSPAQAVLHGILEILPERPALAVSGINYGENVGAGVTISGTVGAALEAAAQGIPALAVSLETDPEHHRSYSTSVDFSAAAHFTVRCARWLLENHLPLDADILKIDVPSKATVQTPMVLTRVSRQNYYEPVASKRSSLDQSNPVGYKRAGDPTQDPPDTDIYVLRVKQHVSVTPLSLDLTARVDLAALRRDLGL